MTERNCIVGIDLGTTNSEVAAMLGDRVQVLGSGGKKILPSCVGLTPAGELLIGEGARNQLLVYPERTVRSIKRRMGSAEKVSIGDRAFSPQEISSLILRELAGWASAAMEVPVQRAVITVPAYFSDAQRNATREAGELAGLEVVRILNEPTAASLAYGYGRDRDDRRNVMVYDLGGGTFDVSVVRTESGVTEVLASHGNNQLGGDDFDDRILDRLVEEFQKRHGVDLRQGDLVPRARLRAAAERAKIILSEEPYARVREEALAFAGGKPLHLDLELSRAEFETMIRPLVESTLDSVSRALQDARLQPADLDAVLLVGGSTRIPLIAEVLASRTGLSPLREVHPELCVALGAGILAARTEGHDLDRVLVDVSPYSYGISHLGVRGGAPYPYCYIPLIERNTPLPITRARSYFTASPYQPAVHIEIFQGEDEDALRNILVGDFEVEGLTPVEEPNEVLCRMQLDLDGILHVSAIEKSTGKSKRISIRGSLTARTPEEVRAARAKLESLFQERAAARAAQAGGEWLDEAVEVPDAGAVEQDLTEAPWAPDLPSPAGSQLSAADRGEDRTAGATAATRSDSAEGSSPAARAAAPSWEQACAEAESLLFRSRGLMSKMHDEDKEEAIELNEAIVGAMNAKDPAALAAAREGLKELLFFVEGRS